MNIFYELLILGGLVILLLLLFMFAWLFILGAIELAGKFLRGE